MRRAAEGPGGLGLAGRLARQEVAELAGRLQRGGWQALGVRRVPEARLDPSEPTIQRRSKPTGRGYRAIRCPRCRATPELCFCAELRHVAVASVVITVVMHFLEEPKPTNTAHLAVQMLSPRARIVLRGAPGLAFDAERTLAQVPAHPVLLHPTPDAATLTPALAATLPRPLHLIVLDGTWGQARRMLRRESRLRQLPTLQLPSGEPTAYHLRRRIHADGVCTLEAIARAVGVLEGAKPRAQLLHTFGVAMERAVRARGYDSAAERDAARSTRPL